MRPAPFLPKIWKEKPSLVHDENGGHIWHWCETRVLYADTDRSQVVYHANHLRFFELGRASFMRDFGYPYREIEESGFIYPIIEVGLTYDAPLFYDDVIRIHTRPGNLERVRVQFDYIITRGEKNETVCRGFTRHCATSASGRPVGVDEKTRELWNRFPKP